MIKFIFGLIVLAGVAGVAWYFYNSYDLFVGPPEKTEQKMAPEESRFNIRIYP